MLNREGIPSGPILTVEEMFKHPQTAAREMLLKLPHPELGEYLTTGLAAKLESTPGKSRGRRWSASIPTESSRRTAIRPTI